jgi:CheY-like chemotaxis protein
MINSSDILHGKILIVDDQEANVLLLEQMLHGSGYVSVTSTLDPLKVCELHRQNRYDLILLDLQMPHMDGFTVMEGLKEIEADGYLPVIVITAQPGHKLRALQSGAKDFIKKPFELPELLARVHNMLEMSLLYREAKSHIKALEQKVKELVESRELIRQQSIEAKRRYDKIVSITGGDAAAAAAAQPDLSRVKGLHTLLYVEDNPANLSLVEHIIARHPEISLLTAVNGNSGIEIARASRPDVILMDINLPDINGYKALEILRSDPATAHIPVIALSGNVMQLNIESGLEAGFFRYLTKPIKINELMETLDVALEFAQQAAMNK